MSAGPDDTDDDDRTVIIPAGQSGRPAASQVSESAWPEEEATRAVDLSPDGVDERPDERDPADAVPGPASTSSRMEVTEGSVLGNYRVGRLIAQGGLGAIHEGVNIHNPAERVAIKVILPDPAMGDRFARMLLDEANALMRVRHDAVVPYRTYGRIADTNEFYLVLEFIDGDTLNDFYRRRPLTEPELFALANRLAAGLQASHEEGLVHRDVSPDNVLLPQSQLEKATLIDFGIAKIGDVEDSPDAQFSGKLSYAAPEQFVRGARIGPWTDVYGLALLLVAAARGQSLPMGSTLEEAQEVRREVPVLEGVPPRLAGPLARMLEPHPADRPQSMREVMALLAAAQEGEGAAPSRAAAAPVREAPSSSKSGIRRMEPQARPKRRRHGGGWASALLVLLGAGAIAGGLILYGSDLFRRERIAGSGSPVATPDPVLPAPKPDSSAPSGKSRSEQLADNLQRLRTRLATLPCAVTRVTMSDRGTSFAADIGGVWSDAAAVEAAAKSVVGTSVAVTMRGNMAEARLCSSIEALGQLGELGRVSLMKPRPGDPATRAVTASVALPPTGAAHLLEIAADGTLALLADLSAGDARSAALAGGDLVDLGGGRFDITLTPSGSGANVEQTLLVLAVGPVIPRATTLEAWIQAMRGMSPVPALDVVPRDGIPALPVPVPPTPAGPPSPAGQEQPETILAALRATLADLPCTMTRVDAGPEGPPFNFRVGGVWGDRSAIEAALAQTGGEERPAIEVTGDTLGAQFCPALDALRAAGAKLGPDVLLSIQSQPGDSRATRIDVALGEDTGFQVFEIDAAGHAIPLLDAASEVAREAAANSGTVSNLNGGRIQIRLLPTGPDANAEASLLLFLSGDGLSPFEAEPASPVPVAAWAKRHAGVLANAALDVGLRPGIPPLPAPVPPAPVSPSEQGSVAARFAAISCSMIRLSPQEGTTKVEGYWGRETEVRAVADAVTQESGTAYVVEGQSLTGRQCSFVDGLKPFFRSDAPATLFPPRATGDADGTSAVELKVDPALPALYLLWVDPAGIVRPLVELASPKAKTDAVAKSRLIEQGSGVFQVRLPRFSPRTDAPPGLLVAISAASPLSAEILRPRGFRDWVRALATLSADNPVRIDIAQYRQAALN